MIHLPPNKPAGPNRRQPLGWRAAVGEAGVTGLTAAVGHPERWTAMRALGHILLLLHLVSNVCFGQTNAPLDAVPVHSLTNLPASTWSWMAAARVRKPLAVLTLTNDVSQESVLSVTDRINANYGIDGYVDGYCGFGARLNREYLGSGSLVEVSFAWDQRPKRTIIALHGTNAPITARWRQDMSQALREKFGDAVDQGRKK